MARRDYHREYSMRPDAKLRQLKRSAAQRGIEFNLSESDIPELGEVCPVLGVPFYTDDDTTNNYRPSIDRIDNTLGYVPGNIEWVSLRANKLKSSATPQEIRSMAEYYGVTRVAPKDALVAEGTILCSKCRQVKPEDEFAHRPDKKNGRHSQCKECVNLAAKSRRRRP